MSSEVLISASFLEDTFAGYRTLGWRFVFLSCVLKEVASLCSSVHRFWQKHAAIMALTPLFVSAFLFPPTAILGTL